MSIGSATPSTSTPPPRAKEVLHPRSTWRKKPSQKGKKRHRLAPRKKLTTPKPPSPLAARKSKSSVGKARRRKKTTEEAGGHGAAAVENPVRRRLDLEEKEAGDDGCTGRGNSPLPVRRRLDLHDDDEGKIGSGGTPLGGFTRAMLMDNLRALAKLSLNDNVVKTKPTPRTSASAPPKIDLRSYSRAQLMDNLSSLAKQHVVDTSTPDEQANATKGKEKKKKATMPTRRAAKLVRVANLVLRRYKSKRRRATAATGDEHGIVAEDDDPISMALVVRNESAGTELVYVPRWEYKSVALPDVKTLRQLVPITPAIEAAYNQLVRSDETCLGDDLDSVPEGPELEEERQRLFVLVDKFMGPARAIIGKREFSNWKGSVLTNVVGTFLTQNVTDVSSSNAFMNLTAKFCLAKNESNVVQSTNGTLITNGHDSGVSKPSDKDLNELLTSIRAREISNWELDKKLIKKVLRERFCWATYKKIKEDIKSFLAKDTSHWKYLLEEAYKNGYRKEETSETIDWEALLHTSFGEIEECIKDRGTYSQMTLRILLLLIRIKRDHGSMDLDWLRYIPRAKAKEYLQSIRGIGYKSVACIRLLSLRHRGFPVDVNVARLVTRLGWVPLQPLGDNIEFHMVEKNPVMAKIQERLEPLFCKAPSPKVYEAHCQLITLGKSICTEKQPNCGACPFTEDCKFYKSQIESARHTLLMDERGKTNMDERIHDVVMVKPSREHMYQCQIEMGQSTERPSTEPIIEIPPTPSHEYPESSSEEEYGSSSEEEYEQEYQEEYGQDYNNIVDIEDAVPYYDVELDLRGIKPVENATTGLSSHGTDMVLIHPHDNPIPIQRRYRLRTEYLAYIIPDGHEILDKFEPRVHGDCNPYLLIIRGYNDHSVNATVLIPCRTANRETFPLDGTYFQINEVFADHSSTHSPIQIKRDILWNFNMCRVYFGTSLSAIAKGQTQEGIQRLFHSGYICCREFDRGSRRATKLSAALYNDNEDEAEKKKGKKRHMPDSSPDSVEGNGKNT